MHDLPDFSRALADIIVSYRTRAGLSQLALAYEIGSSESYVRRLERGTLVPTTPTIILLANTFGVSPGTLLDDIVARMAHYRDAALDSQDTPAPAPAPKRKPRTPSF